MRPPSACLLVLLLAAPAFAGSDDGRVRSLDPESRQLLDSVREQSPTVRRMLARLESSDLITYVRMSPSFGRLRATTRIIGHVPDTRFVLISITSMAAQVDRVLLLGHELQHAVELAEAPWVRDDRGMIEMYERIGWRESSNAFETPAAVEAGRAVREEVYAATRMARNGRAVVGTR
ncbi:MAG: hypothetical protein EHM24_04625 [Acidobacteria bacterium]|nr:MAG: hypothetical protein EHM24_04625 [Acidobacteriota bacterium]